ncbi:hypothetical protein FIV42_00630 [Persicimonas caeni]|uniref:Uncharacterized protein n=1 Tax=Persicimonas caeni TaxID=2292766 RepID=A0A4Y6PM41_PERCE|nr:hypothetical protein [Persicimonas caeni]QDG49289.1 hypothetical protein FIV42_00630 [Persicimonas caeni]QED30510.1 hypothetical protein FRD00_00625 [Persicimonas caeni]
MNFKKFLSRKLLLVMVVIGVGVALAFNGMLDATAAGFLIGAYTAYCGGNVGEWWVQRGT